MKSAYFVINIEDFKGMEEGTLLRYLGSEYRKDEQHYQVAFEVMGVPPTQDSFPKILFV